MQTRIETLQNGLGEAVELIKKGEVVVFPTETVYGLGANAFDPNAVRKIFAAKGRPADNPLIVHIADISWIDRLAVDVSRSAREVIKTFMPGPITVILKRSNLVPDEVTAGLDSVGIRFPIHKAAREFISACGVPLAAPSANTSTKISPTSAEHVFEDMQGKVKLILQGGDCEVGIESTIIDMTSDTPTILRPGAITVDMLAQVLGKVKTLRQDSSGESAWNEIQTLCAKLRYGRSRQSRKRGGGLCEQGRRRQKTCDIGKARLY